MTIDNWVMRAVFGLGKAGVEIPPEVLQLGAAPVAYAIGSQVTKLPSRLGVRLSNELLQCVKRVETSVTRSLVPNDLEDFSTLLRLKGEVLKMTFGFFGNAASPSSTLSGASGKTE